MISVQVGTWYTVVGSMELIASINRSVGSSSSASAYVDAMNSSRALLDVLTDGVAIETESGYSYSTVPEPSTLLLTAGGVVAALGYRRRRTCG